ANTSSSCTPSRRSARPRRRMRFDRSDSSLDTSSTDSSTRRQLDDRLEPAPEHTHPVERYFLGIHHILEPRIVHDLGVDAVAILPCGIENPAEDDDLVVLELDGLRKRRHLPGLHVVGDAFPELERAVFQPYLARGLGHAAVFVDLVLRDGYDKT